MLLRHLTGGRVAFAMGVRELLADRARVMLHVADGTRFKSARAPDGSKQRSLAEWVLADAVWSGGEALHVVQPGDWFSVICLWQQATFAGWRINFQRPLRPSPLGWDTEDLVLDIEVAPDGSWALEDRADFEHAVDGGYFDRETQHAVMNAVEEALASEAGPARGPLRRRLDRPTGAGSGPHRAAGRLGVAPVVIRGVRRWPRSAEAPGPGKSLVRTSW